MIELLKADTKQLGAFKGYDLALQQDDLTEETKELVLQEIKARFKDRVKGDIVGVTIAVYVEVKTKLEMEELE